MKKSSVRNSALPPQPNNLLMISGRPGGANNHSILARSLFALGLLGCLLDTGSRAAVVSYAKDTTAAYTTIQTSSTLKVVLYSIRVTVSAGDVVSTHVQQELTYNGINTPMAGAGILVGTTAAVLDQTSPDFVGWISRFSTSNLSCESNEELTREIVARTGSYKFAAGGTYYINAVFYGDGGVANFGVAPNGEMVAVVENGVTRYETTAYNLSLISGHYVIQPDGVLRVQYALPIASIPAGSMVDCRFQVEASTNVGSGGVQQFGRRTIQAATSTATSGTDLTRAMQNSITYGEHHNTMSHVGGLYCASALSDVYFNSVVYANGTGPNLYVEGPTANGYGHMVVEVRPASSSDYSTDITRNITTVDTTHRVLYSVGPISLAADQVVEVRYQAAFAPSSRVALDAQILRTTSATAITGTVVQPTLQGISAPAYNYTNLVSSTAEKNGGTALTGQYYNVVVFTTSGTLPVMDWGELEVVKR